MIVFGISKRELKAFLERSLNKKEKEIFLSCYKHQGYTFSAAVKKLNGFPESTVKVILRRLKSFNLIDFGNSSSKGKPLNFTELGEMFYKILEDRK